MKRRDLRLNNIFASSTDISSNEASPKSDVALGSDEEVIIAYRPYAGMEKWLKYRFSAWSSVKAWLVILIAVLFFTFGGPGFVLQSIIYILAGSTSSQAAAAAATYVNNLLLGTFFSTVFAIVLLITLRYSLVPTHLGLTFNGIRFIWNKRFGKFKGQIVLWNNIDHIYLAHPKGKTSPQDFCIHFQSHGHNLMRIKLGAIATQEERGRLLKAIEGFAPKAKRDPELLEVLTPPQNHSYTELWLKALSAPPKRERLTPLSAGASLQNGRYVVQEQIGVGGQGTAYLASSHEESNGQPTSSNNTLVVLKESILPVYVDVNIRKQALERFQNEASMLSKLDHPQVVSLKAFFVEDHRSYLVLEHINGCSLKSLVESQGKFPEQNVLQLAMQMCMVLSYLHALTPPVVHRDFTPDNLILDANGVLKLVDFNVAQQSDSTTTGTVVGKHAYIPPEQFRGKPTPQSDIYALGATLYYLLTGADPEPITTSHPIIANDNTTAQMDKIVACATNIDLKLRYASIEALRADLIALCSGSGNL